MIPNLRLASVAGALLVVMAACGGEETPPPMVPDPASTPAAVPTSTISQNLPTIMVIPSDALLRALGGLGLDPDAGQAVRDYEKVLRENGDLKHVIARIEEAFVDRGFPLENLEQQLKQLANEAAADEMEGLETDARTALLATARPDIVIDLDYTAEDDDRSRNGLKKARYTLTALDAHTNKSVASIARTTDSRESAAAAIAGDFTATLGPFQDQIRKRFDDIAANGTEITLRLTVAKGGSTRFGDEANGQTLAEWVNAYLKEKTPNSTYKSVRNSDLEMRFTNIRIHTRLKDGRSYNAFDFASELRRALATTWGVTARNRTQSIGDAALVIESATTEAGR